MASRSTRARVTKKTPTKAPAPAVKEEAEPKVVVEEAKPEATTNGDKKEEVKAEEVKAEEVTGEVKAEEEMEGEEEAEAEAEAEGEGEEAEAEGEGEELGEEELDEEAEQKLLEGEEETEVKEGEETKAKEGEKTEEKKEQTEEEKKAAEEAKKVKAAAEKKQADEKRKTYIPSAGKYNQDEHVYMRLRSVVVGPLELEDLQKELVQDMANKSEEFFYRFHFIEKEEKHVGHIEFRFKSITEADKMIETLKTIKEGVVVKRLVGGMNAAKFDKDVRGINDESEKEKYKRIVAVGGVPESATMEKLQEVFPDARVKFIALKPDGTPKWYAYLELADEEAAKTFADSHKEVEFEGEKLYCRSLRPGKPEDADIDPDHVMSEEERRKLQARINTMKYKLNGGAVLRPLDAQRLRRRVSQLQSLLRANQKRGKGGAGDLPEGTPPAAANKTPNKTPQAGNNQAGNRRGGGRGGGVRGGGVRGGMRGGRGGNQGGVMRGGRFGPGGPNRNMSGPGFHGNMQQQQGMQNPIVSPGRQQGFYGAGRGRGAANQGPVQQQQQQQGGGRQGGNNMYNNPRQTANAVNMLVGLTNLLSQARNQGGSQGTQRGSGTQGNMRNQNQGNMNNQGGNFGGNGGFNDSGSYSGGNFNNQGSDFNSGSGFGGNQGFNNNQGGGGGFNNQAANYGGNQGGNQGGNFNNQGGNRKRPFTGGQGQGQGQQGQTQGKNKQRRRNSQGRGRF